MEGELRKMAGAGGSGEGGPADCGQLAQPSPARGAVGRAALRCLRGARPRAEPDTRPPPRALPAAGPLPRRFLSLSQPLPPRVGDVKIPRKSRVVAPRAEARFRRPAAPSRGARGGAGPGRAVLCSPEAGPRRRRAPGALRPKSCWEIHV